MPNAKSLENGLERKKTLVFNKLYSGESALIFDSCLRFFRQFLLSHWYSDFSVVLRLHAPLVCWLQDCRAPVSECPGLRLEGVAVARICISN